MTTCGRGVDGSISRPFLAPAKVGIFGLSYGGLNCLQALSRDAHKYAAGACNAPVFNWISQSRYDGGTIFDPAHKLPYVPKQLPVGPEPTVAGPRWPATAQKLSGMARDSSPVAFLDNITGPLLLVHGDLDEEVPFQESLSLSRYLRNKAKRAKKANIVLETLFLPDECHGECAYANQLKASEEIVRFLKRHLL